MNDDAKSSKAPIVFLWAAAFLLSPLRFISGFTFANLASKLEPHPLALEKFGIRVVASKEHGSCDNHNEVYEALELLNRFDQEKLELVKKHIRIIFLFPTKKDTGYEPVGRVCLINFHKLPAEYSQELVPVAIASFLVYFAVKAELTGKFRLYFGPVSAEAKKISRDESDKVSKNLRAVLRHEQS